MNGILNESIYRKRLYPNLKDWSVHKLHKDRAGFIKEINTIVRDYLVEIHGDELGEIINKCIYKENFRLRNNPWKVDPQNEPLFWKKIKNELEKHSNATDEVKRKVYPALLYKIINRYSEEIVGNFNISTFLFARKFATAFFSSIYNKAFHRGIPQLWWSRRKLIKKMKVYGEVDLGRTLLDKGTVIVVPTHSSNIDSIQIGFLLDFVTGFPHFSYGAGLNLYNSEIAAYFMNRLAAYRVDRRKKNIIYLETLKSMSQLAVQKGVNNLFFPGGTRSRSGQIESNIKKGLLSTLINAQRNNYHNQNDEKVFIIPLILSYNHIFEAPQLIDQHLRKIGRGKYISSRPPGRNFMQILKLGYKLMTKSDEIYAYFSHPIDVFGNKVNSKGESINEGKVVDIKEYFMSNGKLTKDTQRESVYTNFLAQKIKEKFYTDNIVLASHAVAFFVFEYWREDYKHIDFFEFLRISPVELRLNIHSMMPGFSVFIAALRQMAVEGQFHLEPIFAEADEEILKQSLKYLGVYHSKLPLYRDRNGYLKTDNLNVLYFYRNRLEGYDLTKVNCFK